MGIYMRNLAEFSNVWDEMKDTGVSLGKASRTEIFKNLRC
jgi:hypothetical protein